MKRKDVKKEIPYNEEYAQLGVRKYVIGDYEFMVISWAAFIRLMETKQ